MTLFAGLDVSVRETSVCVIDAAGKVSAERKVATEPDDLIELLRSISSEYGRIGLEAGPLSQWLVNGLAEAGLPVVCVETRHMKALLKAQQINKSDRNDARGIAQMMRVGLFKPVHVKTLASQERRMLLVYQVMQDMSAVWFSVEDSFHQYCDGLLDEATWQANLTGLRNGVRSPYLRAAWPFVRLSTLDADFVSLVDEMLSNTKPTTTGQTIYAYRASISREIEAASAATPRL